MNALILRNACIINKKLMYSDFPLLELFDSAIRILFQALNSNGGKIIFKSAKNSKGNIFENSSVVKEIIIFHK